MRNYLVSLIVGCGGILGALSRYWVGNLFQVKNGDFPLGTLIINLTGSFVLGLFLTFITERHIVLRLFFATGFLGAYTTFSSFTNETLTLFRQGYLATGLIYSLISLLGGMLCVYLGFRLALRIRLQEM